MALTRLARPLGLVAASLAATGAGTARAQPRIEPPPEHPTLLDRPHTVAEFEAGILALPDAPISAAHQGGATPIGRVGNGDATLELGLHFLYRPTREWAIGAGALLAPSPTNDHNYYGGASSLPRTHSRSYLVLGGEGRYFAVHLRWLEAWVGVTTGVVVVGDRYSIDSAPQVPGILDPEGGTNTYTTSTRGLALGGQLGADYLITDQWVLGLTLRGEAWFLPTLTGSSQCDALGDCPTLSGTVGAFEIGLGVGYRIPL
jgi:hypothetical protein